MSSHAGSRSTAVVLVAAGLGARLGDAVPKAFASLAGEPLLAHSLRAIDSWGPAEIVVVVPPDRVGETVSLVRALVDRSSVRVCAGGETRQASVRAGLDRASEVDALLCHDAARPFARPELFDRVLAALDRAEGAIPVVPVPDTLKRVSGGFVVDTLPRDATALAQTPQAFRAEALRDAHRRAPGGLLATDDAQLLELAGYRVAIVEGDPANFKLTTRDDFDHAEAVLTRAGT